MVCEFFEDRDLCLFSLLPPQPLAHCWAAQPLLRWWKSRIHQVNLAYCVLQRVEAPFSQSSYKGTCVQVPGHKPIWKRYHFPNLLIFFSSTRQEYHFS